MEMRKELLPPDKLKAKPQDESALGFGKIFTDHMFVADYTEGQGWHDARIVPYGPFSLDPAALVLHYAQECFEGLKAYRGKDGSVYLFRPEGNAQRMINSCERICIAPPPQDLFLDGTKELVKTEKEWVPSSPGTSLYIRPTIIATEAMVGVKVSSTYLFYIILSPVGTYFPQGFNPVSIYVEEKYIRAAPGGLGHAKVGANYAASLLAAREAQAKGFAQVLWLDACDKKTIEEVGTMNMCFVIKGEVITAPLGGTILPGVTRDSMVKLCQQWGIKVSERRLTIDELIEVQKSGALEEAFGCGTAAVISPVGQFTYKGQDYQVADGKNGAISKKLYDEIVGIQYAEKPDPFGWRVKVA